MAKLTDTQVLTIRSAWCAETSYNGWSPAKPSAGQALVTALVIQDLAGGQILRSPTETARYWNELPDGSKYDIIGGDPYAACQYCDRISLLRNEQTMARYLLLRKRAEKAYIRERSR